MRYLVLLAAGLVAAAGCGKKAETPSQEGVPAERPAGKGDAAKAPTKGEAKEKAAPARDMAEYVKELRETVPIRVEEFKARKLRCSTYNTAQVAGVEVFDNMTLVIDPPVTLSDALTGKTARYTGARLQRGSGGDVLATGSSPDAAMLRKQGFVPFFWDEVVMVPESKG